MLTAATASLLGCASASSDVELELPHMNREGIRSEALGCWRITDAPAKIGKRGTWWLPLYLEFDRVVVEQDLVRGYRRAWRLDSLGHRQLKDVEGFDISDKWAADSLSDRVAISTGNGLYGATLVLTLDGNASMDTMRGHGREYGDVIPAPIVPIVPVIATRMACRPDPSRR